MTKLPINLNDLLRQRTVDSERSEMQNPIALRSVRNP